MHTSVGKQSSDSFCALFTLAKINGMVNTSSNKGIKMGSTVYNPEETLNLNKTVTSNVYNYSTASKCTDMHDTRFNIGLKCLISKLGFILFNLVYTQEH